MNNVLSLLPVLCMASIGLARAQTSPAAPAKNAALTPEQVASIQKILADAKPDTYSISQARDGKEVLRIGSASMRELTTVQSFNRAGASKASSTVISECLNVTIKVFTRSFSQLYPEKVRQINAILEKNAGR